MADDLRIEDPFDACRSILHFMRLCRNSGDLNDAIREALLEDLCCKSGEIHTSNRAAVLTEALNYWAPDRINELFPCEAFNASALSQLNKDPRETRDIGIITIIKPELESTLFALEQSVEEDYVIHGSYRYWSGKIDRISKPSFSYVVSMVGEPRNVPCAIAVHNLVNHYSVGLLLLIGIAAGARGKVKLGDVIAAKAVYDYEHVRSEKMGFIDRLISRREINEKPRPGWYDVDKNLLNDLAVFNSDNFKNFFKNTIHNTPEAWLPPNTEKRDLSPSYTASTMAAGERLFADGTLNRFWQSDERIRGADMEDSGFAQACEFHKIPWAIFRGISDYGDPHKNDGWHHIAALSAACAGISFLSRSYAPRNGSI